MTHSPSRSALALAFTLAVTAAFGTLAPVAAQQQTTAVPAGYVPEFGTMWTFDAPPLDYWQARYGFRPDQTWLDHLRLSAVRLPGCSASFVSPDGLIMTNHHCSRGCIAQVSPPDTSYLRTGFVAQKPEDEIRCPGMTADQLVSIKDVTSQIRGRITASTAERQVAQRDSAIDIVRSACEEASGLRCQVVAFYNGGMYSLYTYKRYSDLRLVMAPELETAYFGGDEDNFTYPRYDLDVSFLRAYENGQPVQPKDYLAWSEAGARDGEVVFVVGNPGSTGRLLTLAQMEYLRDVTYPTRLADYAARMKILKKLSAESPQSARRYETTMLGISNSQKATQGYLSGLLDPKIMARKASFEKDFRSRIDADSTLRAKYGGTWDAISDAQLELATFATQARYYAMRGSTLLGYAINLVRVAQQSALPTDQRLPGFQDSQIERMRSRLLRDQPLNTEMERMQLADWLASAQKDLGADDALVKALLAGRTPEVAADEIVRTSPLKEVAERKRLLEGGAEAVARCQDPLVVAIRDLVPTADSYVRRAAQLNAVVSANEAKLGQAIYAAYGKALPPDATFTLRISDGVVKGFPMNGTIAPYKTTFYGLFARSADFDDEPPFRLTDKWKMAETKVDMHTPMNFVSTADIIGGNSGSPVVNRAGEVVGLVFDGNIEMLPNRFIFTDEVSRCVSVSSRALTEALRKVYDAGWIADEIQGRKR